MGGERRPLPCLYCSSIVSLLHPVVAESSSICDFRWHQIQSHFLGVKLDTRISKVASHTEDLIGDLL